MKKKLIRGSQSQMLFFIFNAKTFFQNIFIKKHTKTFKKISQKLVEKN